MREYHPFNTNKYFNYIRVHLIGEFCTTFIEVNTEWSVDRLYARVLDVNFPAHLYLKSEREREGERETREGGARCRFHGADEKRKDSGGNVIERADEQQYKAVACVVNVNERDRRPVRPRACHRECSFTVPVILPRRASRSLFIRTFREKALTIGRSLSYPAEAK